MKNQPAMGTDLNQDYVHDPAALAPFESKSGRKGGRGKGVDKPGMQRAMDTDYATAWKGRRSGSKPELRPDIRHA